MSKSKRIFWSLTVAFFLSGCSSYKMVTLPNTDPGQAEENEKSPLVQGSTVRLTLYSGEVLNVVVSEVSPTGLTVYYQKSDPTQSPLDRSLENSMTKRQVSFQEIEFVEKETRDINTKLISKVLILGLVVGLGVAALVSFGSSMGSTSMY